MSITALRIITEADETPILLAEAKAHLRITHNAEDGYIDTVISDATAWAQEYTRRIFIDTQVELKIDRFPETGESPELVGDPLGHYFRVNPNQLRKKEAQKRDKAILLPGGFVSAVNDIDYIDADGAPQTLTGPTSGTPGTDYQEDLTDDEWPLLFCGQTVAWPAVSSSAVNAVTIDYQVGWLSAAEVPGNIRAAIRFKVDDMFRLRGSADMKGPQQTVAENLLDPFVVPMF